MKSIMQSIKDKKGLQFKSAFFMIIIGSLLIISTGVIIGKWSPDYNSGVDYDIGGLSRLNEVSQEASDQQGRITVRSANQGEEFEGTSIRGVFGLINTLHTSLSIVFGSQGIIASVIQRFNLPDYIRLVIVTMISFAITYSIIAILFRLPRSSSV